MEVLLNLGALDISLPVWQIIVYVAVFTYFALRNKFRYSVAATFVFVIYWLFYVSWPSLLVVAAGSPLGIIAYIAFGFVLAGLCVYAYFFFGSTGPSLGLPSHGMSRLERSLAKRLDRLESAVRDGRTKGSEGKVLRELEENLLARIDRLQSGVKDGGEGDKEGFSEAQGAEFKKLRAETEEMVAALQAQLQEKDEQLRSREFESREVQENMAAQLRTLEGELTRRNGALEEKEAEIRKLRAGTDDRLEELKGHLQRKEEMLSGQESTWKQMEEKLSAKVLGLENKLAETEGLVLARTREFNELKAEAQKRVAGLEAQLEEKQALLVANKERSQADRNLSTRVVELESQLVKKDELLTARAQELSGLKAQSQKRVAELDAQVQQQKQAMLKEKDAALREAEGGLQARVRSLEAQLKEKEHTLETVRQELSRKAGKGEPVESHALAARVLELENELSKREGLLLERTRELKEVKADAASMATRVEELEAQLKASPEPVSVSVAASGGNQIDIEMATKVHELERALMAKEEALRAKTTEITELTAQAKEQIAELVSGIQKREELLQLKDFAAKEVEDSLRAKVRDLELELRGQKEPAGNKVVSLAERSSQQDDNGRTKKGRHAH